MDNTSSNDTPLATSTTSTDTQEKNHHTPATILAAASTAQTLTLSDQQANILLTIGSIRNNDDGDNQETNKMTCEKALIKLTLVPFHKTDLANPLPMKEEGNESSSSIQQEHSQKVLRFLAQWDWRMTSESGAEYSFHEAFLKDGPKIIKNKEQEDPGAASRTGKEPPYKKAKKRSGDDNDNIQETATTTSARGAVFKAELIYPASERQVARAMPSPGFAMITEIPRLYQVVTKPFVEGMIASGSLSWLENIVHLKKEQERLLWNADDWILNIDTKWQTHPDPLTVPRKEWYQHASTVQDLYCLGIVKASGIFSLRDLRQQHLPMLRDMLEQGPKVIKQIYGVAPDQLRIFVHYPPQFYHFHVHFVRLENETGIQVERAHLLADVIQDLERDPNYFQTRTITYKLSVQEKLYHLMSTAQQQEEEESKSSN